MDESISVFDMFKIGVGPSSSHTLGPWRAALMFINKLKERGIFEQVHHIKVLLYGSLAKTGVGHGTDIAVLLGLQGADPVTFDVNAINPTIDYIRQEKKLKLGNEQIIDFDAQDDLVFLMNESLPFHPNGMSILASTTDGQDICETYYSIGGGFVQQEGSESQNRNFKVLPFPINAAKDLLHWCRATGLSIHEVVLENESAWRPEAETRAGLLRIWQVMKDCIYRGSHIQGELPGGLNVRRRAADMNVQLLKDQSHTDYDSWVRDIQSAGDSFTKTIQWVSTAALAVNEENASFGRVVTAPTNGAAGVIPAVLFYTTVFLKKDRDDDIINFLLTAAEVGSIFKKGATISAAMGGCQAEIGVSSAMAAAALAEALGATQRQCLMAAEIAMEHHLGLTCDPIAGLVQIPCIERNTMGAIKAITAAQLALSGAPDYAKVSLDSVIKTMWETAQDMNHKYKETADGGLAVNVPLGLSEC